METKACPNQNPVWLAYSASKNPQAKSEASRSDSKTSSANLRQSAPSERPLWSSPSKERRRSKLFQRIARLAVSGVFGTRKNRRADGRVYRAFWAGYDGGTAPKLGADVVTAYDVGKAVREGDEQSQEESLLEINGYPVSEVKFAVWQEMPPEVWTDARALDNLLKYNVRSIGRALQEMAHEGLIEREHGEPPVYRRRKN